MGETGYWGVLVRKLKRMERERVVETGSGRGGFAGKGFHEAGESA